MVHVNVSACPNLSFHLAAVILFHLPKVHDGSSSVFAALLYSICEG